MDTPSHSTKKRKIPQDDDDDHEEEKIEKFYALIKSIRETCGHLIMSKEAADRQQNKTKKQKFEEKKQVVVWKPSFQREDFMEEAEGQKKPPVTSSASTPSQLQETTDSDQKEQAKEALDLSLSL